MGETLLVPIDPTGCGHEVAEVAAELAGKLGADVVLLHAAQLPGGVPADTVLHTHDALEGQSALEALAQDARDHLRTLAEVFAARGVPVRLEVRAGDPAAVILACSRACRSSMIVMGTHGRRGVARVLLGSVAEQVLRRADCPVLTVRTHAASTHPGLSRTQELVASEADG